MGSRQKKNDAFIPSFNASSISESKRILRSSVFRVYAIITRCLAIMKDMSLNTEYDGCWWRYRDICEWRAHEPSLVYFNYHRARSSRSDKRLPRKAEGLVHAVRWTRPITSEMRARAPSLAHAGVTRSSRTASLWSCGDAWSLTRAVRTYTHARTHEEPRVYVCVVTKR